MPLRPILQKEAAILREIARPIPETLFGSDELAHILSDMTETLHEQSDGVALAAPQIGISYRIFIVRYDRTVVTTTDEDAEKLKKLLPEVGIFINPEFVRSSRRRIEMDEGCLSVRGLYGTTLRHERATVRARDADGKKFERGGGNLLAQIYQHEIDHLNGVLFTDHAIAYIERNTKSIDTEMLDENV